MNKNVKIAKQLVKIAKDLVAYNSNKFFWGDLHECIKKGHEAFDCYVPEVQDVYYNEFDRQFGAQFNQLKQEDGDKLIVVGVNAIVNRNIYPLGRYFVDEARKMIENGYEKCKKVATVQGMITRKIAVDTDNYVWVYATYSDRFIELSGMKIGDPHASDEIEVVEELDPKNGLWRPF